MQIICASIATYKGFIKVNSLLVLNTGFFSTVFCVRRFKIPHRRIRYIVEHVFEFDKGRIMLYTDLGLSFRETATHVGRNQVIETEYGQNFWREGLHQLCHTSKCKDRPLVHMLMAHRTETSIILVPELGSGAEQSLWAIPFHVIYSREEFQKTHCCDYNWLYTKDVFGCNGRWSADVDKRTIQHCIFRRITIGP